MKVQITIELEDIVQDVPVSKVVRAYGESEILGCFTVMQIVNRIDTDSLLETIGEEKIRDFLNQIEKQEIA